MKKLMFLAALLVGACGSNQWVRGDGTSSEADFTDCRYEADKAAAPIIGSVDRAVRTNDLMESCLRQRGYRQASR